MNNIKTLMVGEHFPLHAGILETSVNLVYAGMPCGSKVGTYSVIVSKIFGPFKSEYNLYFPSDKRDLTNILKVEGIDGMLRVLDVNEYYLEVRHYID